MKKAVALAIGAALAFSLAPVASFASHCPGSTFEGGDNVPATTMSAPTLYIRSGQNGAVPANPANEDGYSGLLARYGCERPEQEGVTDLRYLSPQATGLKVRVVHYNPAFAAPAAGCLRFNAAFSTATCPGGGITLSWSKVPFTAGLQTNLYLWTSQNVAIPVGTTYVNARGILLQSDDYFVPAKTWTTKYLKFPAP